MTTVTLRLSVVALFVDGTEVLLLHQMTPPEPDCWDLPGGGLDPAEDLASGLRREVAEETGIYHFQIERLLTVMEGFYPAGSETMHAISLVYQCRVQPRPRTFECDPKEVGPGGVRWLQVAELSRDQCSSRTWKALRAAGLVSSGVDSPCNDGG